MSRILVVLSLILLAAAAPAEAGRQTEGPLAVALKERAVIHGEVVRLGDLFHGLDERADKVIARAPEPGQSVELSARWLAALAQGHNIDWRPESHLTQVVVERASQVIDAERVSALIGARLAETGANGDISVIMDNPGLRLHLPSGVEPSLRLVGFSHDPVNGRFRGQIVAPAAGPVAVQSYVSGRAIEMVQVPVLSRQVAPGETIGRPDIGWSRVRADRLARNIVASAEDLIGMSPRRPIGVAQPVRSDELQTPVVVAKNSLVTVKLQTDRMLLTAQARALENGARGETIRVMNTKSNTVINAVVVDSGSVSVPSASLAAAR